MAARFCCLLRLHLVCLPLCFCPSFALHVGCPSLSPPCCFFFKSLLEGVRNISPIHPKFVQAGCLLCSSRWLWSCLHGTHLHLNSPAPSADSKSSDGRLLPSDPVAPQGRARPPPGQGQGLLPLNRFPPHPQALRVLHPACSWFCLLHPLFFPFNC